MIRSYAAVEHCIHGISASYAIRDGHQHACPKCDAEWISEQTKIFGTTRPRQTSLAERKEMQRQIYEARQIIMDRRHKDLEIRDAARKRASKMSERRRLRQFRDEVCHCLINHKRLSADLVFEGLWCIVDTFSSKDGPTHKTMNAFHALELRKDPNYQAPPNPESSGGVILQGAARSGINLDSQFEVSELKKEIGRLGFLLAETTNSLSKSAEDLAAIYGFMNRLTS